MNYTTDKYISCLTISELKALIKECLREVEEEKQRATIAPITYRYVTES